MDTLQIEAILSNDFMTKDIFRGVYPIDKVPTDLKYGGYVINTDESYKPGEHWIVMFIPNKGDAEYFDSFGQPPQQRLLVKDFVYNAVRLQKTLSNACGFYCVYYILMRARGMNMKEIIYNLCNSDADYIVKNLIFNNYKSLFA